MHADLSVRPALDTDAEAIGAIHAAALKRLVVATTHDAEVVAANAGITDQAIAAQWLYSITMPPSPQHFVLTALDANTVVGFIALAPVEDATLEIIAFEVATTGQGHGSRLLNAAVDVARQRGAQRVNVWINPDDDARTRFFNEAGFGPAGARRSYEVGQSSVDEHLWYCLIDE